MIKIHGKITDLDTPKNIVNPIMLKDTPIKTYEGFVLGHVTDVDMEKSEWSGVIYSDATYSYFKEDNNGNTIIESVEIG